MNFGTNFDTAVKEAENFTSIEKVQLGGHIVKILKIEELEKNNKTLLNIFFDFDKSDVQADYFMNLFNKQKVNNSDTKYKGIYRLFTTTNAGETNPFFSRFIANVQLSNPNYVFNKNAPKPLESLKNKLIGMIFGEEEFELNGEIKVAIKPFYTAPTKGVDDAAIPKRKEVQRSNNTFNSFDGFTEVSDNTPLPF